MTDQTSVSEATVKEERAEAGGAHESGAGPTPEEAAAADRGREATEDDGQAVAEHYSEMTDIGAKVKGEGAIE